MTLPAPKKAASASLLKQMSCVHAVQRTYRGRQAARHPPPGDEPCMSHTPGPSTRGAAIDWAGQAGRQGLLTFSGLRLTVHGIMAPNSVGSSSVVVWLDT